MTELEAKLQRAKAEGLRAAGRFCASFANMADPALCELLQKSLNDMADETERGQTEPPWLREEPQ